jgi:hypothetical protein
MEQVQATKEWKPSQPNQFWTGAKWRKENIPASLQMFSASKSQTDLRVIPNARIVNRPDDQSEAGLESA